MRKWIFIIFTVLTLFGPGGVSAGENYPSFDREYWVTQQSLAKGKIKRGAGLGVLGVVSIWPTSMMIARAAKEPVRYWAPAAIFGMGTVGAILHGFGSVGYGKKQRDTARSFVSQYDAQGDAVDVASQQQVYLHDTRKTATKTMLFGIYLSAMSAVLLSNGVTQTVRNHRGADLDGVRIWPYYLGGSLLAAAGTGIILLSKKKLDQLDTLEQSSEQFSEQSSEQSLEQSSVALSDHGLAPLVIVEPNGDAVLGVSMGTSF